MDHSESIIIFTLFFMNFKVHVTRRNRGGFHVKMILLYKESIYSQMVPFTRKGKK
jgi:hypothetical protein